MAEIDEIKKEISLIKERNERVELDKAWEVSKFRILSIVLITYATTAVVFYLIGIRNFLFNALIPAIGYYLSTQSLPVIKKWWINRYKKRTH